MIYKDNTYDFFIADTSVNPLEGSTPSSKEIRNSYKNQWFYLHQVGEKIFAKSNNEEDDCEEITLQDKYISAFIALSLAKHLGCIDNYCIKKYNKKISLNWYGC